MNAIHALQHPDEPFYQPQDNEQAMFEQAWHHGMPVPVSYTHLTLPTIYSV